MAKKVKIPSPEDYFKEEEKDIPSPQEYFADVKKKEEPVVGSETSTSVGGDTGLNSAIQSAPQFTRFTQPQEELSIERPQEQPLVSPEIKFDLRSIDFNKPQEDKLGKDLWKTLKTSSASVGSAMLGARGLLEKTMFNAVSAPIRRALGDSEEEIEAARASIVSPQVAITEQLQMASNLYSQKVNETMKQYNAGIIESLQDKDYEGATRQLLRGVVGSLPYLALVAATGPAGSAATLTTIGTTAASQRLGELEATGKMSNNKLKQVSNAWMYGGFEAAGELVTAGILNNMRRALSGASTEVIKQESGKIATTLLKELFGEAGSEASTELGQQVTDYVMGERDSIDLKQVGDAAIIGFTSVGPIAGTTAMTNAVRGSRVASTKDIQNVQENQERIMDLKAEAETVPSSEAKQSIQEEIKNTEQKNEDIYDKNIEIANNLTPEQFNRVSELNKAIGIYEERIANKKVKEEDSSLEDTILKKLNQDRDEVLNKAQNEAAEPRSQEKGTEIPLKEEKPLETQKQGINDIVNNVRIRPTTDRGKVDSTPQIKDEETGEYRNLTDDEQTVYSDYRYEQDLSERSQEQLDKLPEYKGKKFSRAVVDRGGNIRNVYASQGDLFHREYMKPEDIKGYESGELALVQVVDGKLSIVPQNELNADWNEKRYVKGQPDKIPVRDIVENKINDNIKFPEVEQKVGGQEGDTQNIEGVQGREPQGEEPGRAVQEQGTGAEAVETGGVLQTSEKEVKPLTTDINKILDTEIKKTRKEKLSEKEEEVVGRLKDRLDRLSGAKFVMENGEKNPSTAEDIIGAIADLAELGLIKIEKGVDHIVNNLNKYLPNIKKSDIEKYLDDINKAYSPMINATVEPSTKATKTIIRETTGVKKERESILTNDYELLKSKFKNIERGSKEGFKGAIELKDRAIKYLNDKIKEQKPQGFYQREMMSAVNALKSAKNETSLSRAIERIDESFNKIQRKDNINDAQNKRRQATKSLKAGGFSSQSESVKEFLTINPSLVRTEYWDKYKSFIDALSARGEKNYNVNEFNDFVKRLKEDVDLEVERLITTKEERTAIYDRIDEMSNIERDQVLDNIVNEFGVTEQYAKELYDRYIKNPKQERDETPIELMIGLRDAVENDISNRIKKLVPTKGGTEVIGRVPVPTDNMSKEDIAFVEDFLNIKKEDLSIFSNNELSGLEIILDKLEQGWISNRAWSKYLKPIKINNTRKGVDPAINKAAEAQSKFVRFIGSGLDFFRKKRFDKQVVIDQLRGDVLFRLDDYIGKDRDRPLYKGLLAPLSNADVMARDGAKDIIDEAKLITSKIKRSAFDSSVLMKFYQLQKEHLANGGEGDIVSRYVEATTGERVRLDSTDPLTKEAAVYDRAAKERIKELYDLVPKNENGDLDVDALWNKLESAEKKFIEFASNIDKNDLKNKVKFATEVLRGQYFKPINEHTRIVADTGGEAFSENPVSDLMSNAPDRGRLSAKAGSSYERTPGIKPIRFDAVGDFFRATREAYYDYHLTPAINTVFGTLQQISKEAGANKMVRDYADGLYKVFEQTLKTEYSANNLELNDFDRAVRIMLRASYESMLASVRRLPSEGLSNAFAAVLVHPDYLIKGAQTPQSFKPVMDFYGSPHADRLSGRDSVDMLASEVRESSADRLRTTHKPLYYFNKFAENNPIRKISKRIAQTEIQFGDKVVGSPYWKGAFLVNFKKNTKQDFSIDKFNNEPDYRKEFKDEIIKAGREADFVSNVLINTSSPLETMQSMRGKDPNSIRQHVDNFVRSFNANEASAMFASTKSLMGRGTIGKWEAARTMGAILGRQYLYTMLMQATYNMLTFAIAPKDEQEKKYKQLKQMFSGENLARDFIAANLSLLVGKYGNFIKYGIAIGTEHLNRKLTEKKLGRPYDRYTDAIAFLPVKDINSTKDLSKAAGSYALPLRLAWDISDAITKGGDYANGLDFADMALTGLNLSMGVPFYKDIDQIITAIDYSNASYQKVSTALYNAIEKNDYNMLAESVKKIKGYNFDTHKSDLYKRFYYGVMSKENPDAFSGFNVDIVINTTLPNKDKAEYLYRLHKKGGYDDLINMLNGKITNPYSGGEISIISDNLYESYLELVDQRK